MRIKPVIWAVVILVGVFLWTMEILIAVDIYHVWKFFHE